MDCNVISHQNERNTNTPSSRNKKIISFYSTKRTKSSSTPTTRLYRREDSTKSTNEHVHPFIQSCTQKHIYISVKKTYTRSHSFIRATRPRSGSLQTYYQAHAYIKFSTRPGCTAQNNIQHQRSPEGQVYMRT